MFKELKLKGYDSLLQKKVGVSKQVDFWYIYIDYSLKLGELDDL